MFLYIVNVKDTTLDLASKYCYGSCTKYWEDVFSPLCANSICDAEINDDYEIVGAHVYKCNYLDFISGKKIYIASLCKSFNGKKGYSYYETISLLSEDFNGNR